MIRDDIFSSKDRTKFFDFIVPVVPVVNGSNSYDILYKEFSEFKWPENISQTDNYFLHEVSMYIDDLRLLNNILNEFYVYCGALNNIELDGNKLFAMITYKNIFPEDYANLHLRKGYIFWIFSRTDELISKRKKEISDDSIEVEEETHSLSRDTNQDQFNNGEKLNRLKFADLVKECNAKESIFKKNKPKVKIKETVKNELSSTNDRDDFTEDFYTTPPDDEYIQRIEKSGYIGLLKFLILNGYLDETYCDYMTYFRPYSLKSNDKKFVQHVLERRSLPYEYKLENLGEIVNSLEISLFSLHEILNFDIMDYLLCNNFQERLDIVCERIKEESNIEFVQKYYGLNRHRKEFVQKLNCIWPDFFSTVICAEDMDDIFVRSYCYDSLCMNNNAELLQMNEGALLANYISTQTVYLNLDIYDCLHLLDKLSDLQVKFEQVDVAAEHSIKLLDGIFYRKLYKVNPINIKTILTKEFSFDVEEDFSRSLSFIFKSEKKQYEDCFRSYLTACMDDTLEAVLEITNDSFFDDEDVCIEVLNDISISVEKRLAYAERNTTTIQILSKVNDTQIHKILVHNFCVACTAENMLFYYSKYKLDDDLLELINSSDEILNFDSENKKLLDEMLVDLMTNNVLDDEKFREVVRGSTKKFPQIEKNYLERRVRILIQEKRIDMSLAMLGFIRNNYKNLKKEFIFCNFDKYLSLPSSGFNVEDVCDALEDDRIDASMKLQLLKKVPNTKVPIKDRNYPDDIIVQIIKTHLSNDDKENIYADYSNYSEIVRAEIVKIAEKNITEINKNHPTMDKKLVLDLLNKSTIGETIKSSFSNFYMELNEGNTDTTRIDRDLDLQQITNTESKDAEAMVAITSEESFCDENKQ